MKRNDIKPGSVVVYNDGRKGHSGVKAEVLNVCDTEMIVQFEDRADTTTIRFSDKAWMNFLTLA